VPFDLEVGLMADIGQFRFWNADIYIHDAMAFPAREVVVVAVPAGPVGMASIRKFNPVQQPHVDQHLDRPEYRGTAQVRVYLLEIMPEVFYAKILAAGSQLRQTGGDPIPGLGFTPPTLFERGTDFFSYSHRVTLGVHR
jgi:hypothetical protein